MKFSMKMAVLSLAGVLALGGAATAASFIFKETSQVGTVTADGAIVLNWGDNNTLASVEELKYGAPVEQVVEANWSKSDSVTSGKIVFTFTLTDSKNLRIEIADQSREVEGVQAIETLNGDGVATIESNLGSETSKKLYLRYTIVTNSETYSDQSFTASLNVNVKYVSDAE